MLQPIVSTLAADQPDLSGPAIMRESGRYDRPLTEIGA